MFSALFFSTFSSPNIYIGAKGYAKESIIDKQTIKKEYFNQKPK